MEYPTSRFSVVIPSYNRGELIERTILSAINQSFAPYEIIIIDDGSTDNTKEIVSAIGSPLVRYFKTENRERGAARNKGASLAKGDYVYFLDSDDILYPNHFEEAAKFIYAQDHPQWFFQHYEFQKADGSRKQIEYDAKHPIKTLVCVGNFMSCHGVFLNRSLIWTHPFSEDRDISGSEDYALWLVLAARYPLEINRVTTSALVEHEGRSVLNFDPSDLISRKTKMLAFSLKDEVIRQVFLKWIPQLKAHTYSYISLHCALVGDKNVSLNYLLKALKAYPNHFFSKRTLAILKHILIS